MTRYLHSENYESSIDELSNAQRQLPPLYTRLLGLGICALVGGTMTWATFSKVDEVASATGDVIPASQIQPLRSLASGLRERTEWWIGISSSAR